MTFDQYEQLWDSDLEGGYPREPFCFSASNQCSKGEARAVEGPGLVSDPEGWSTATAETPWKPKNVRDTSSRTMRTAV